MYNPLCLSWWFFLKLLFIYWLCWVFVSVRGLSPVAASRGHSSLRCAGLSLSQPLLLQSTGSRRAGSVVVAQLLRGMWDLPRPGLEPVSPALAGGLSTTAPPGKPDPDDFDPLKESSWWARDLRYDFVYFLDKDFRNKRAFCQLWFTQEKVWLKTS